MAGSANRDVERRFLGPDKQNRTRRMAPEFYGKTALLSLVMLVWHGLAEAENIGGLVLDRTTAQPLDSVRVVILDQSQKLLDSTMTDASGRWQCQLLSHTLEPHLGPPTQFWVSPFYPNPFALSTCLQVILPEPGPLRIVIHDVLGRQVHEQTFALPAGLSALLWEGRGSPGVYVATITARGQRVLHKMIQLGYGSGRGLVLVRPAHPTSLPRVSRQSEERLSIIFQKFAYVPDTVVAPPESCATLLTYLETVHAHAVVADLHNDVLNKVAEAGPYHLGDLHTYNHTDIPRLVLGGIDVQVFAIWIDPEQYAQQPFLRAMEYVALWRNELAQNTDRLGQATSAGEIEGLVHQGRIAGLLAVEGGHAIENSLENLRALYRAGVRMLTITWNNSTSWAVSASDTRSATVGLSPFGRQVIALMDSLGMVIDVSHTGEQTIRDILEVTRNPIIASHSGARALRDHVRNLKDEQILAIASTGGVIGVVFYPSFLAPSGQRVSVNTVADHIDYIARVAGIDHVAIGSDFDGISRTPQGLEDCAHLPNLTWTLLRRGYTRDEVEKILGGNFLRVFKTVCQRARS
ncbi:MAG: membrane dipeptidase [candidate division KSB1 bacterium]|nr:membrane dipeptidase [candidate division KSB1 bacterium]